MVDAALGTTPISSLQAGIETTRGVTKAATRVIPFLSCDITPNNEMSRRPETRGSYIRNYRKPLKTKHWVDVSLELIGSYEQFIYWAAGGLKGVLTGSTVYSTGRQFAYTPTTGSDDLKTYTLEALTDVTSGDYDIPFSVVQGLSWGWEEGGPMSLNAQLLGQQLTAQSPTGALSAITDEEMDPATALAYVDAAGGTLGATAITNLKAVRYTMANAFDPDFLPDGFSYPGNWVRVDQRALRVEATFDFTTATEAAAFAAVTGRLFRTKITGSTIASSSPSTPKSIITDCALTWDEGPFRRNNGRIQVTMTGESYLDSAASLDWAVTVDCDTTTSLSTT